MPPPSPPTERIGRKDRRLCHRAAAFTLADLLVAMAVLALVIVMLSQLTSHIGSIWLHLHARAEKNEGARAALEFITKELQAAQLPVNRTAQASLQLIVNPVATVGEKYRNRDAIFWQAPLAANQSRGDIAEIGYFVQWDETNQSNPRARLCRLFVNPTDANYKIYSSATDQSTDAGPLWIDNDIIAAVAPADKSNTQNPYQGLFVENVLGLWITCLDPTGSPITTDATGNVMAENTFNSRRGYIYTDSKGKSVTRAGCALPAAVDLSLVILDNHSAALITGPLEKAIQDLVNKADIKDADDFVKRAQSDSALKAVRSALYSCKTRIYLQNSK